MDTDNGTENTWGGAVITWRGAKGIKWEICNTVNNKMKNIYNTHLVIKIK